MNRRDLIKIGASMAAVPGLATGSPSNAALFGLQHDKTGVLSLRHERFAL